MRARAGSVSLSSICGLLIGTSLIVLLPLDGWGACLVERARTSSTFKLHIGTGCSEREREAAAVSAGDLLGALKQGAAIDLLRVVITGDLRLDQLPLVPVKTLGQLPPYVMEAIRERNVKDVRLIAGPLSIRDSRIRGGIHTGIKEGLVVIGGPVTMTGTTFEQGLDLSLTAFQGPVDFSHAVLLREGYFIRAVFTQPVHFEQTAFGIHSRFHKAVFHDPVTFHRAGFNGLAEFLQVSFEKEARFSQTYFKMGAGFSGSRFHGTLDFSEVVFARDVYFTFTVFEADAYFRRATFRGQADFSDADFKGLDDFSKALFDTEPRFTRTRNSGSRVTARGLQDPRVLYGIAAGVFLFAVVFVIVLRRNA